MTGNFNFDAAWSSLHFWSRLSHSPQHPSPNSSLHSTATSQHLDSTHYKLNLIPYTPDFLLCHGDNTAYTVTSLHILEGLVDLVQRLTVGDEFVNLEVTVKVVLDETGQLAAALDTAKGTALPHAASYKLECYFGNGGQYRGSSCDKNREHWVNLRLVAISCPAAATPMMIDSPQPLWHASSAARITPVLPVQSNV